MTTGRPRRQTIIGRVGLLGASAGIVLGLIEAAFLRLTYLPLVLQKPQVPLSFWFFAPLLTAIFFGLLGLLAGIIAALPTSRFLGMLTIAAFVGLAGIHLSLAVQFTQSGAMWYPALSYLTTPTVLFYLVFVWTFLALWATRHPDSPLGFMDNARPRLWSGIVFGAMAVMAITLGIYHIPDHLLGSTTAVASVPRTPNIVLIVWDTTRADHFSSYGYSRNTTPNVDALARRGVLFENAISASSWTLPSMAGVFTDLLPHQHGAGARPLGNAPRTLAEILRTGGYETAGFNANPYFGDVPWGLGRGFETYVDSTRTFGYSLDATRVGREVVEHYSDKWFDRSRYNQYDAGELNEQAYRWFRHRSGRPYFLFLNYNDAHQPYEAPAPYDNLYGHATKDAKRLVHTAYPPRFYLPPRERNGVIGTYDECLTYIDSQVGELLRYLARSPDWSNTYVIITSDHGDGFGEHGTYSHGWNLYREVVHVPLVVAGPGIPAGVRIKDTARTPEIFPTALQMAGMKGKVLQETSLGRWWNPERAPNAPEEPALSELLENTTFASPKGLISITTNEWQLIYQPGEHRSQLYHWSIDPLEQQNVADLPENQAIVEQLKEDLFSIAGKSYRPWRNSRYLLALSGPDFSLAPGANKSAPTFPGGLILPQEIGAAQALFPPNPDRHPTGNGNPDEELLESLPYDAR